MVSDRAPWPVDDGCYYCGSKRHHYTECALVPEWVPTAQMSCKATGAMVALHIHLAENPPDDPTLMVMGEDDCYRLAARAAHCGRLVLDSLEADRLPKDAA